MELSLEDYYKETDRVLRISKELLSLETGWEPISISSKTVKAYRRPAAAGLYIIKAEGEINRTPPEIVECLKDLDHKHLYDASFDKGHIVKLLADDIGIVYQRFKAIWPTSGRDFCLLQRKIDLEEGAIVAVAVSTQHPECPEVPECVRGVIHFGCHFMFPTGPNVTRMVYFLLLDVKGYIPAFVVNFTQSTQAMFVENLRIYLANNSN
ncbi:hypothetical protein SteCoe_7653 [Stentor coeruleus]|uniref:START domain-containing protein n=1 Tax=Stentor coeruleus TaxID=5963 RepID=A0A1R2CM54_9CILI|nr:hypothetical protein SteCoe_7653 [Stentor coeruleus]